MRRDLFAVLLFFSVSLMAGRAVAQEVVVSTALGEIHVVLESQRAPVTVANFLRYVDGKRFDNITLYRAV